MNIPARLSLLVLLAVAGCSSPEHRNPTDPAAQVKLGNLYSSGTFFVDKNEEKAFGWYRKAALQGDPEAEYRLGLCYDQGLGVPKNIMQARAWYLKSAMAGNAGGQYELGNCYRLAKGGPENFVQAYLWLNLAAASGNESARSSRDAIARRMSDAEVLRAQRLSQRFWDSQQ